MVKVYVIEAQELVATGFTGSADPYAAVYVGNQKSRTNAMPNTLQPVWNEMLSLYVPQDYTRFSSFVDNPNDKMHIVVWDSTAAEGADPLGKCEYALPMEHGYDQRMITEWVPLVSQDGRQSRGRIRLGIQYIFDQALMLDTVIKRREEEKDTLMTELTSTQKILDITSSISASDIPR